MSLATDYRPTDFNEVIGQTTIVNTLAKEFENNNIKQSYLFMGQSGSGKAQPLYSKVLTPNGYITMGEVKVGTEVIGDDGKPHKVLGVFPQGKKPVYELTFNDGAKCRCSDEHLWTISTNHRKSWKTVELKEIINKPLKKNSWVNHIPITKPIEYNCDYSLPIDPWVFGILLGDGGFTDNSISITITEDDIKERIINYLTINEFELSQQSKNMVNCIDFRIKDTKYNHDTQNLSRVNGKFGNRFCQTIYDLGLLGCKSEHKFIPNIYKHSKYEDRLNLLRGLLDSDGYINMVYGRHGTISTNTMLSTSSKQLAEDIVELIQSLGGTCTCNKHKTTYTYKGSKKQGLDNYELYIKLPTNIVPVSSNKHLNKFIAPNIEPYRTIRAIDYIGEEECQCIYIDSLSHLYLTDDMIVTHNTTLANIIANKVNGQTLMIDTAVNNSAEDVRNIVDSIQTKPLIYDKVVVIFDEVHTLSPKGFASLLLTLEKPPAHVIFILCTTEGDKIPETIKNRCECFTFTRIENKDISTRLAYICKDKGITYEDKALELISNLADGSMRQAIAIVEKLDNNITYSRVSDEIKYGGYEVLFNLFYSVCDKDTFVIVNNTKGINNIDKFIDEFFTFILDIVIYGKTKNINLTKIPKTALDMLEDLQASDFAIADKLMNKMFELQYNGKNSPIIRELFLATLLEVTK